MDDAGFIVVSYVVDVRRHRRLRAGACCAAAARLAEQLPDEAKPWI